MERGLSRNTLAAYRRDLTGFGRWLAEHRQCPMLAAQRSDLLAYMADRVAAEAKPRTTAMEPASVWKIHTTRSLRVNKFGTASV